MRVYMISEPLIRWPAYAQFLTDEGLPGTETYRVAPRSCGELLPEVAGRLCYMSYGKGRKSNKEYLDNIIKQQHFSVLEHANWGFIITGISRACTHEFVRHRHFSYSQLSQRYVDHSEAKIVVPRDIEETSLGMMLESFSQEGRDLYLQAVTELERDVETMSVIEKKRIRGIARAFLTEATETKIMVTGNARAWREFIQKRNTTFADAEIRAVAQEILRQLLISAENVFNDLESWPPE